MVGLKLRGPILVAGLLVCAITVAHAQQSVGRVSLSKGASISANPGAAFRESKVGDSVPNGATVRTERREFAEITFTDDSRLRVNERTDLIVRDVNQLRTMRLQRGALWVRVTKGSGTTIQTPVATATVRGTEFVIQDDGEMTVFEGVVDYEAGGVTIPVEAGESVAVGSDGKPVKTSDQPLNSDDMGWWVMMMGPAGGLTAIQQAVAGATVITGLLAADFNGPSNPVPEPATVVALSIGVAAMLRKKRK